MYFPVSFGQLLDCNYLNSKIGLGTCFALDCFVLWISFQAEAVIISNWNVVSELVDLQLAWMMIGGLWI